MSDAAWGSDVVRRAIGVPFLMYEERHHHVSRLLGEAEPWGDRVHLVQGERRITFEQMTTAVEAVAARLWAAGLRPGARAMILAPNSPEWVITLWASIRIGAVTALGNGWWSPSEVAHAVHLIEPSMVVADTKRGSLLPSDLAPDAVVDVGKVRRWVDEAGPPGAERVPTPGEGEDAPTVLIFTAGTTGFPKAVILPHRSVIANLQGLLAVSHRLPHQLDRTKPPAVVLQSGPLFHVGGFQSLLLALVGGSRVVFLAGRFDAEEVLDLVEREQVTVWGAIPTMASRVLEHPSLADHDVRSVRSISMGGAPVLPELTDRLRQAFPNAQRGLSTIYGMTETGGTVASASGRLMAEHPLTSGRPMPVVDLRIERPDSHGVGEIVVRTPGQMLGYWGEEGSDIIDEDGWLHTGDLGRFDEGLLWVTGRSKDVIIRGGENIAAAHVEQALLSHPDVAVVAVVGLPHPDLGEEVGAVVQLRAGARDDEAGLAAHAAGHLARFEVPARWWLWRTEMPMTDAGKVEKHRLREQWLASGKVQHLLNEETTTVDWKLELVPIPVADVDRAKAFYVDQVGFHDDHDHQVHDGLRFVQLTPPGSACSIVLGVGITTMRPGSQQGVQIVVDDVEAARRQLVERGVEVSDVDVQPWGSFVTFADPDGNSWSLQQLPIRQ